MTETNLIFVVHLLCLVHLPILSIVDSYLHLMYGGLIRMAGFVVAADMAAMASAGPVGAVATPKVVDVGANAPKVVPAQGVLVVLGPHEVE